MQKNDKIYEVVPTNNKNNKQGQMVPGQTMSLQQLFWFKFGLNWVQITKNIICFHFFLILNKTNWPNTGQKRIFVCPLFFILNNKNKIKIEQIWPKMAQKWSKNTFLTFCVHFVSFKKKNLNKIEHFKNLGQKWAKNGPKMDQ